MFRTGVVRAKQGYLLDFFNMKVYCVISLESPQRGDSNEYIQYPIFNIKEKYTKKESHLKLSQICRYGIFSKGLKDKFEVAVVNETSVFEPLKFYITCKMELSIYIVLLSFL